MKLCCLKYTATTQEHRNIKSNRMKKLSSNAVIFAIDEVDINDKYIAGDK